MSSCCPSAGCEIFTNFVIPEGMIHSRLGSFYAKNPIMSRVIATPVGLICGVAKVFLFPVICLVSLVAMPIMAIIRSSPPNKKDGGEWLKAWLFSFIGLAAYVAILCVPVFYLNLVTSIGLFIALFSFSIVIHIYKFVKEPQPPQQVEGLPV